MERHHQPSGIEAELEGLVETLLVALGSKSEHTRPVLILDEGRYVQLHVEGDSYFEAPTLHALTGNRIRITGRWDNFILRVSTDDIMVLNENDGEAIAGPAVVTEEPPPGDAEAKVAPRQEIPSGE
jgi:hypothetical protein